MSQSPSPFDAASPLFAQLPGMNAMQDALAFVKNMWGGGMPSPGVAMPSLSVDGINKQIADLKAVESWLALNMNMLRGTIQALEVQSATFTTLQTMGETMQAAMQPAVAAAQPVTEAMQAQMPGAFFGKSAGTPEKADPTQASTAQIWQSESPFSFQPPTAEKPPAPAAEPAREDGAAASPADGMSSDGAAMAGIPPFANPAAWWNLLQDQFRQAAETAAASMEEPAAPKPRAARSSASKAGSAKKTAAKSSARTSAAPDGAKRSAARGGSTAKSAAARKKSAAGTTRGTSARGSGGGRARKA